MLARVFIPFLHLCIVKITLTATPDVTADPKFSSPIVNVTVPVGREAILTCIVHDLVSYKVAWLRVDTQTILTIQSHIITKNHRIGITHTENRIWQLRIRDVRESDRGWYMCQINTDPMKSQVGYLDIVVPPDISDYATSKDMNVAEGSNLTLTCAAVGSPEPTITWRRERGKPLLSIGSREIFNIEGATVTIPRVNRHHMGAYLCIASNGIPPTVSKRVTVTVNFSPTIWVKNRSFHVAIGQKLTLECITESYPQSVNFWVHEKGEIIQGESTETVIVDNVYKVVMKLVIRPVEPSHFGVYKCVAKNEIGESEDVIHVHHKSAKIIETLQYQPKSYTNDVAENKGEWTSNHAMQGRNANPIILLLLASTFSIILKS